jgi:signal transduction histidine kinase
MSARVAARLAWSLWALTITLLALGALLHVITAPAPWTRIIWGVLAVIPAATVGALLASRRAGIFIGWILCLFALLAALMVFANAYAVYALFTAPGSLPGGVALAWIGSWIFTLANALLGYLVLTFPSGRLPSQRWRLYAWLYTGVVALVTLAAALQPGPLDSIPAVRNPITIAGAASVLASVLTLVHRIEPPLGLLVVLPFVASLVLRFRRARGEERQQFKWLAYAVVVTVVWVTVFPFLQRLHVLTSEAMNDVLWGLAYASFPIAVGVAILKYRLYAIDLLINRTLVYGSLVGIVVSLYILLVGGLGVMFQASGNLLLSILATGLIAFLFHPLRARLQRGVNRLLYGQRDEPYAVLSRLGQRLEATLAPGAVLPAIVETVREALNLPYAALSLKQGDAFALTASAGVAAEELVALPLVYHHDPIGELLVAQRAPGEPLTPTDQRLLSDLARQAGVAAHAVRLTSELERLTVDLQRSRERLVTAREEERRRLRRDLHDGLGPTLASMTLKLDAAGNLLTQQPAAIGPILSDVSAQLKATIVEIRRLVYDLRPPALDELGLVSALREQAPQYRQLHGVQVTIEAPPQLPPLPAAVEVAAYRIVLEALTNVARHACAQSCWVRLALTESETEALAQALTIEVLDDGQGLPSRSPMGVGLASMRERAEELGGSCVISNGATGGALVLVQLPLAKQEAMG